jgi:hypothetical protein
MHDKFMNKPMHGTFNEERQAMRITHLEVQVGRCSMLGNGQLDQHLLQEKEPDVVPLQIHLYT